MNWKITAVELGLEESEKLGFYVQKLGKKLLVQKLDKRIKMSCMKSFRKKLDVDFICNNKIN